MKNFLYIKQQLIALLRSTSNTVKCIWLIVFVSYSFSFFEQAVDVISVTPGYFIPPSFRIWTAFTFCFLETHFWNVFTDIIMIGLCGKVIEPLWGPTEIISFFSIVNLGVAFLSSLFFLFVYMCTSNPDFLFKVHIHGLLGYIAGVTVAVKQIMPDILIIKTPTGRITNRNMPLLTVFIVFILWFVGLSPISNLVMVISGVYVSWLYLRFYQRHSCGNKGDMSESFNFSSFFPCIIQPPIAVVANTMYNILIRMKLCKQRSGPIDSGSELSSITVGGTNLILQDKERRKQKALKALSEHLNKSDRPRIVGTVMPQKNKMLSPKKKGDLPSSSAPVFTSTEEESLIPNVEHVENPINSV